MTNLANAPDRDPTVYVLPQLHRGSEMHDWQPISTAPKDGTRFLSCDADDNISVGWWEKIEPAPEPADYMFSWLLDHGKRWETKEQFDALVLEFTPQAPVPADGFWTSEYKVFDCRQEEQPLTHWMRLPLPRRRTCGCG